MRFSSFKARLAGALAALSAKYEVGVVRMVRRAVFWMALHSG
jgi:hypothetical protein